MTYKPPSEPEYQEPTLADHYNAALHSVALINDYLEDGKVEAPEDLGTLWRNVEHLRIVLVREPWTQEFDLQPLRDAVALGKEYVE
jgi:hypothetical protein